MPNQALNALIIRTAVLEQLVLNLLAERTGDAFSEMRGRFEASRAKATTGGDRAFAAMSLDYIAELERRLREVGR